MAHSPCSVYDPGETPINDFLCTRYDLLYFKPLFTFAIYWLFLHLHLNQRSKVQFFHYFFFNSNLYLLFNSISAPASINSFAMSVRLLYAACINAVHPSLFMNCHFTYFVDSNQHWIEWIIWQYQKTHFQQPTWLQSNQH